MTEGIPQHEHWRGEQYVATSQVHVESHLFEQQYESAAHTLATQPWVPSHDDDSADPVEQRSWVHVPSVGVVQHDPLSHVPLHVEPHVPQLALSSCVFAHAPLQHVSLLQLLPH
jgi:hypothetical protein